MEIEQLLSFVRYQRGQKQGWDALDEVLTAVVESDVKLKDQAKQVAALDAQLKVKLAALADVDAECKAKLKQCQADQDAYALRVAGDVNAALADKDAALDEKHKALYEYDTMIATRKDQLIGLEEEVALQENYVRSAKSEYDDVRKAIEDLKAKLR